ncbi:hypothetical protein CPB86DRAFT_815323 [Serendipita vermifera]|nr:hypothetical protein CPB86DRAFT_815323 [Serendipita vermifera]
MFDDNGKADIALDGLVWLANHIEISSASQDTFITLIKGLTEVPAPSLMDEEKIKDVPWKAIFEILCSPYIGEKDYNADELERAMWICKGMGITPSFESPTCQRFLEDLLKSDDRSTSGMACFVTYKRRDKGEAAVWIGIAFEQTNESICQIGYNYLHFMLLSAKKEWPNMGTWERADLAKSMAKAWSIPSVAIRDGSSSTILPIHSIELVLDLAIPRDGKNIIDACYFAAIQPSENRNYRDRRWMDDLCGVLRMLMQHLILQISHNCGTFSDFTKELALFSWFMDSKQLDLVEEKDNFICVMLNKFTEKKQDEREKYLTFFVEDLDAFVRSILRFDLDESTNLNGLAQIRDRCLAWIVSWHCPDDVQFQALIHPNFNERNTTIEQGVIHLFDFHPLSQNIVDSDARMTLLRALLLDGPENTRTKALHCFYWYVWRSSNSEKVIIHS